MHEKTEEKKLHGTNYQLSTDRNEIQIQPRPRIRTKKSFIHFQCRRERTTNE